MKVVGLEGFWGLLYYSILLPIFQNIHCTGQLCPDGVLEDTKLAFQQMGDNHRLILQSVGIIISIACFNATGVAITKYASAAQRSTIDTSRTVLIWIIALLQHQETFLVGEFFGFVILVGATLVYNEIWVLPCASFNENTKKKLQAKQVDHIQSGITSEGVGASGQNPDYIATSPGAAYDHSRNLRALDSQLNQRQKLLEQH